MTAKPSIKIADSGERTRALRRARINSVFVRTMRWLLPAGAVLLLGFYGVFMQKSVNVETARHGGKLRTNPVSSNTLENLAMLDPSYEGYNKKDGSRYRVSAKRAITDLSPDKPIDLERIIGAFQRKNGKSTAVSATRGRFDQKLGTLTLKDGIDLKAPNGLRLVMNSATLDTKAASLVSTEPVLVETPTARVRSNAIRVEQRARSIVFDQGVSAQLRRSARARGQKDKSTGSDRPAGGIGFTANSSAPVDVTAGSLTITEKERTATFSGNVRATQEGRTLEAPKLVVAFAGGASAFSGLVDGTVRSAREAIKAAPSNRLRQIIARDGVRIKQNKNRITAQTAIFDAETKKAELIGKVKIHDAARRLIEADRATLDSETNKVVLTGKVIAKDAQNILRGRRLVYQPKSARMQLSAPGSRGGKIFVRFRLPQNRASKRRAEPVPTGFAFRTNPNAPIEIEARQLDVSDLKSTARFDGGVSARQGELVLTAPSLTAHYSGQIGLSNDGANRSGGRRSMKLKFIRASKPVEVKSGDNMKANGERAQFNLLANTVTISGNVELHQGRQKLFGEQLVIDLTTGRSRLKSGAPKTVQKRSFTFGAAPQIKSGQRDCGGRMCLVFFPQDAKKRQAARKKAAKRARTPARPRPRPNNDWSASTSTN